MTAMKKVAIIGGGIGGLTVAHELAERGDFEITIYEKSDSCGGKAKSLITKDGYPAEHSIRTISYTYYHFRDTLKRIPLNDEHHNALENVIEPEAGARKYLFFNNYNFCILPSYFPYTPSGIMEYIRFLRAMARIVTYRDILSFQLKLIKCASLTPKRKMETLEKISWDEYIDIKNKSENYRKYLHKLPEFYVAARGDANARSMSLMIERTLFLPLLHPIASQTSSHDVFKRSTNDALIEPWISYLKKKGVVFQYANTAKHIEVNNNLVEYVTVQSEEKIEKKIQADIYVIAIPVESITQLIQHNNKLKMSAPSLSHLDKLNTEDTTGMQFYLVESLKEKFPRGWVAFMDSPWSIVAFYRDGPYFDLKPPVVGFITIAFSNFDALGIVYGKPARECTALEMKEEVWAQMAAAKGMEFLKEVKIFSWHISPEIEFDKNTGKMLKNNAPLFVPLPNHYQYQPEAYTEIKNLFLAADYVRTTFDVATMEAANEAGRNAANAILKYSNHPAKPCFARENVRTGFGLFQWFDQILYGIQSYLNLKK